MKHVDLIDKAFDFLDGEYKSYKNLDKSHNIKIKNFKRLQIMDDVFDADKSDDTIILATPDQLERPLNYSMIVYRDRNEHGETPSIGDGHNHYNLINCRQINPSETRGKILKIFPNMYQMSQAVLMEYGKSVTIKNYIGNRGDWWWNITPTNRDIDKPFPLEQRDMTLLQTCVGLQFESDFWWTAEIRKEKDAPSLQFFTDSEGARSLFKDRNKPQGYQRRPAIRHWVREHYRKKRNTNYEMIKIMKHLKGKTIFNWHGYEIILRVSQEEIDKWIRELEK